MKRASLIRRTPLRRVNTERAEREQERQFGDLAKYVRTLRCCIPWCPCAAVAAHVHTRRNHGAWITPVDGGPKRGNIVPMCVRHHLEQHQHGIKTFQREHGLNLELIATRVGRDFGAAA